MAQGRPIASSESILETVFSCQSRVSSAVSSAHKWQNYKENIEHGFCLQPMLLCIRSGPRMAFALLFIRTKGLEHSEHPSVGKEFITVAFL